MEAPILVKPIPPQVVNEGAAYGPFDLKRFIQAPDGNPNILFYAELKSGAALPKGMICTTDGLLTGIPAKGTEGNYEILLTAENQAGSAKASFILTIKPSMSMTGGEYTSRLKSQVWQALEENLPIPDFSDVYNRPITAVEMYYLLERWGVLTIWDAFNLERPAEKILLSLPDVSPHYNVFDRGSCIVGAPKDLYSHERTLADGLQTARAMAREVFKRDWTVELIGFDKLARAAWVEFQLLSNQYGKEIEIVNYQPSISDINIYSNEIVRTVTPQGRLE